MKRAAFFERRRFVEDEEPEEELNLLGALLLAVEALREVSGGSGRMEKAATLLDRKAMKLRAREDATVKLPEFCLCGNNKRDGALFCTRCFSEIPVKLWMDYHSARRGFLKKSFAAIEDWVRSRRRPCLADGRKLVVRGRKAAR